MELKNYQKKTMSDLTLYLHHLESSRNMVTAYENYWTDQDVRVGFGGVPLYRETIPGTPHICFKVPTGGGKTFMACTSIRRIFDTMPKGEPQVVVWLVPSNTILAQTINNLSDVNHPYRQRLNFDFSGRVAVYTKEQLLNGQSFSPETVREQLSICILSYDSLRSNKKEGRKSYQENSQLMPFTKIYSTPETLIEDVDATALIQVLNQLSPVIIVDESHNAQSDLSVEMLINLNPSFVLDLTATPKNNSNIISYVDARELKTENMVKLPIVVYNRTSRQSVIHDAIHFRSQIEQQAKEEERLGGRAYIRPIILFQAQPKNKDDSETFDKIKKKLIEMGIPKEEIAIKTSEINELKNKDLMSRDCPIRYIITVNALKEGWDCPFAYILASLANKTSAVDVEQIVGRILRQPYTKQHKAPLLNSSYVFTCSNDFRETLDKIVSGLNKAGFSRKDFRIGDGTSANNGPEPEEQRQLDLFTPPELSVDNFEDIVPEEIRTTIENPETASRTITAMMEQAKKQSEEYNTEVSTNEDNGFLGGELGEMMNQFGIQEQLADEALNLKLPQFYIKTAPSLFGGEFTLLTKEALSDGFSLSGQDSQINFELAAGEMYRVDIEDKGEAVPKYFRVTKSEEREIQIYLATLPSQNKLKACTKMICEQINRSNSLSAGEITDYVERIVKNMSAAEADALETAVIPYANKIRTKIESLEDKYREKQFGQKIDAGEIICRADYILPKVITPVDKIDSIPSSLYEAEKNDMNDFEFEVINRVVGFGNVKWWHRIMDRRPEEFVLNGFINHYPDFMVMTNSGVLVLIETKGDYLWNEESEQKLRLGRAWQAQAGSKYRYFMVFKQKPVNADGAYTLDEFAGVMKNL